MVNLNPSAMAIGALAVIFAILLSGMADIPLFQTEIASLSSQGLIVLLAVGVLVILTSVRRLATIANLLIGALIFTLIYQLPGIRQVFADGRVFFIAAFLIVVAVYMRRAKGFDLI